MNRTNRTDHLDILVFGAHPDDAEIGMGATIYKHAKAGYRVGICDLTEAEMSSNGTVESRRDEAAEAGRLLSLAERSNLGLPDRGLRQEQDQLNAIVAEIRRTKPRIVFAPYWQDRHPDHVMCGKLVEEAVFNARLRKQLPDVEPHMVTHMYYYFINDLSEPQFLVDVSEEHERKMASLIAYRTQFFQSTEAVVTPINQGFLEGIEARDRSLGSRAGMRYAEGFVSKRPHVIPVFPTS